MDSGIPWITNKACNFPNVVAEEADFTGNASIHLENASTTTIKVCNYQQAQHSPFEVHTKVVLERTIGGGVPMMVSS